MSPVCTVCRSPDRDEIDRSLVTGSEGTRAIAGRYPDLSRSPIERHARVCLRLAAPADRLTGLAARAELAAVATSAVQRATELLDREEGRGNARGTVAALGALSRVLGTAERLHPADAGFDHDDVKALLLVLVERVSDPAVRASILDGMHERDADHLAGALDESWQRRDARAVAVAETQRAVTG